MVCHGTANVASDEDGSDPYEEPENAEIVINSSGVSPQRLVEEIYEKIKNIGYL